MRIGDNWMVICGLAIAVVGAVWSGDVILRQESRAAEISGKIEDARRALDESRARVVAADQAELVGRVHFSTAWLNRTASPGQPGSKVHSTAARDYGRSMEIAITRMGEASGLSENDYMTQDTRTWLIKGGAQSDEDAFKFLDTHLGELRAEANASMEEIANRIKKLSLDQDRESETLKWHKWISLSITILGLLFGAVGEARKIARERAASRQEALPTR